MTGRFARLRLHTSIFNGKVRVTDRPSQPRSDLHTLPTTIRELLSRTSGDNPSVAVHGWVQSIRKMKNVSFAVINDGTTTQNVQVVLTPSQAKGLTIGSAAKITGSWEHSLKGAGQRRELVAEGVKILGTSDPASYPLQKKAHSLEYLRTIPHLRFRSRTGKSLALLRSAAISSLHDFFQSRGFLQTHPPIITSSDCEGAGEVFSIVEHGFRPFFRNPAYLTVSTQLHLEAMALASSRVWSLSPVFRAEKSDTARHLNEFYMLEAELAFLEGIEPLMSLVEEMIKKLIEEIVSDPLLATDLSDNTSSIDSSPLELEKRWAGLSSTCWPRISYSEAISILQQAISSGKQEFRFPVEWGLNLQSEHEKYIAEVVGEGTPVFVTHFPVDLKPFYMLPTSSDERTEGRPTADCFDLLLPKIGEIVGGSLREYRYDVLKESMKRRQVSQATEANLSWYLELRKWGSVPHGGFGLGFDRFLAYVAGMENIREIAAFPRWHDRCQC